MTFLILTAIEEEYREARNHLSKITEIELDDGTIFEEGYFEECIRIIIAKTGMGNIKSAIKSDISIKALNPDYLFFVGIAGGIKDLDIGDVLVAEKFYYMENGKVKEKFLARPESTHSSYRIIERATIEARKDDWKKNGLAGHSNNNKVIIGNICSGEKVIAENSEERLSFNEIVRQHYNDSHAVDMESGGLIASSWINSFSNLVVIRGISDLLVKKEETELDGSRERAIKHAFAFAFHLIKVMYQKNKKNTTFIVTLNADVSILKSSKFEEIISELRRLSNDDSINLKFHSMGSLNLHLEGNIDAVNKLKELFQSGKLKVISDIEILNITEPLIVTKKTGLLEMKEAAKEVVIELEKITNAAVKEKLHDDLLRKKSALVKRVIYRRQDNNKGYLIASYVDYGKTGELPHELVNRISVPITNESGHPIMITYLSTKYSPQLSVYEGFKFNIRKSVDKIFNPAKKVIYFGGQPSVKNVRFKELNSIIKGEVDSAFFVIIESFHDSDLLTPPININAEIIFEK